ncbi:glycosyltransferase family 2 protein [Agaribacterium haliotis]|uniref:glycosyltransferase family 2 protein n=1 Tax=Agaribacterium haliotis TaxID=2013869 RepID=UPI000BB55C98|nr:glycosyltransferase family 2 protein [Agaribacterium haliotis]
MSSPSLAIVVPCYNEEEALAFSFNKLNDVRQQLLDEQLISEQSKLYFVDDGSKDQTWAKLSSLAEQYPFVCAIKLSRNRGHQNALYAGLISTSEDAVVSIDADLQDDPQCIVDMVKLYSQGTDVVYGVREERTSDTRFKRFTAESYYSLMRRMGVDLVFNHADYRLLSRRALEALKQYPERNLFLRGLVRELGFSSATVSYRREERVAGESKYPLRKMLSFAWEGISSFSTAPLRAITVLGFFSSLISVLVLCWVLFLRIFTEATVPGWTSILLPLLFIGSVQLVSLGIIGEYLAKIFDEVKARPRFHIESSKNNNNKN